MKAQPLLHPRPENNLNFLLDLAEEPGAKFDNIVEFGPNLHNRYGIVCAVEPSF